MAAQITTYGGLKAGMLAWLLMLPLALTSFNAAIRKLGGKRWQALHRLAYLSAIAGVVHFLWQGKATLLDPLIYAAILAVLLAARVVIYLLKLRKWSAPPPPGPIACLPPMSDASQTNTKEKLPETGR